MITKLLASYFIIVIGTVLLLKVISNEVYEWTYYDITCGEAIFRANGVAAPQDKRQTGMFYECVFFGIKRWDENKNPIGRY